MNNSNSKKWILINTERTGYAGVIDKHWENVIVEDKR